METGPKIAIGIVVTLVLLFGLLMLPAVVKRASKGGAGGAEEPPPGMTAEELTNTSWQVKVQNFDVTIRLNPGGQAVPTLPPQAINMLKMLAPNVDPTQIRGTWSVNGNQLKLGVDLPPTPMTENQPKHVEVNCTMRNKQVFFKNEKGEEVEARRVS